jgi:hypothetical protein
MVNDKTEEEISREWTRNKCLTTCDINNCPYSLKRLRKKKDNKNKDKEKKNVM